MENGRAKCSRVLLVRATEYAATPALPRFAQVLSALVGPGGVHAVCWRTNPKSATPVDASDPAIVTHFERAANSRSVSGLVGLPLWWLHVAAKLIGGRYAMVQASDVLSLVPCVALKPFLRYVLIADIRDHAASLAGTHWGMKARVLGWLEQIMVALADAVIVVEENRKALLPGRVVRRGRAHVVRNLPQHDVGASPSRCGEAVRINYSGYLSMIRGAGALIEAVQQDPSATLDVVGETNDPALTPMLAAAARISRPGRVSHREAMRRMGDSDLVALLYDPTVAANRYAAPNKFYEAMMLGRPVLVSEGTPMAEWVRDWKCGYVVAYGSVKDIGVVLRKVRTERSEWAAKCSHARMIYERELRWKDEASRLAALYRELGVGSSSPPTNNSAHMMKEVE